jgi:hypothetical protein
MGVGLRAVFPGKGIDEGLQPLPGSVVGLYEIEGHRYLLLRTGDSQFYRLPIGI